MHWVIGLQTSVLAVDPVVACELALGPLGCGPRAHGEGCLRQLSMDKKDGSPGFHPRSLITQLELKIQA